MIVGATLLTLLVLNATQKTECLDEVVWGALIALVVWFVVLGVIPSLKARKGKE